jgi:gluconolactonase
MTRSSNRALHADGRRVTTWLPGWILVSGGPAFDRLVPPGATLRRLVTGATWAEGPVWRPESGDVLWSDVRGNRVLRWSPAEPPSVFLDPSEFQNGRVLDLDGLVIACSQGRRGIERLGRDGVWTTLVDRYRGARLNSPNDVVVKSDGTIWFTDPPYGILSDEEGTAAPSEIGTCLVFRFDPATGALEAVTDALEHPNGLAFSPDESVLYVSDTSAAVAASGAGNHHILAFGVVGGRALGDPRPFYVCEPGLADGFRADTEGNIFTSARDGIHVLSPDGRQLGRIPVPEVTANCVFGGPDGTTLFITATTSLYAIETAARGATWRP